MSRQPFHLLEDGDQPPPYSTVPVFPGPSYFCDTAQSREHVPQGSSLFSTQLSALRSQMLDEQAALSCVRNKQDIEIMSLLVPHVEALIESVASHDPPPTLVEATFVPDEAIGKEWTLSDSEQRRSGEVRTLIRVGRQCKAGGVEKQQQYSSPGESEASAPKEFDGWGRWSDDGEHGKFGAQDCLWWSDEDMARRLARHLQPARATWPVDCRTIRAQVEQSETAKTIGRWSMFNERRPAKTAPTASSSSTPHQTSLEDVRMTVNAEEATFRKQSVVGLWESRTG
ncbi:uncharacterized protein MAM_07363 [Metarhizium album ARSEF 1941]|uniref:Uncharacterized protein n=1 Tax=Metarhizium album (strain ARSEF 1941) TaxID=1081103 RepID=A0A0B2WMS2_METAS|nr:uncharacterized protein MAM_07363 [Metarhizium album ARSEF 1941]KHN94767.1 hypothetical protein MAM_07363 [Metarhizium album ARSEF 1941]